MNTWRDSWRPARLEERLPDGVVRCHLSPRKCTLRDGQHGFCGVRGNRGGRLVTMNYGKSVHVTEETIETEAVNHYAPGERILSLGNIGCMLNCSYCHNWKTSQAKHVDDRDVFHYTPEAVVETAVRHGIRVLSWTYNDPVVWHEFVRDTARIAHKRGLINLYKSAFFISEEAIDELLPFIDIFSISLKSLDPEYYRRWTSGRLEPVLDGIRHVHRAGKHLELSTLMITDVSDDERTARAVSEWALQHLDASVPLHFVRFHPDYKMRNSVRTPIPRLVRAREIALETGIEHVYLGNVYDSPWTHSYCRHCESLLVERYGLNATISGLDDQGFCTQCRRDAHFRLLPRGTPPALSDSPSASCELKQSFEWHGDIRAIHVQLENHTDRSMPFCWRRTTSAAGATKWTCRHLAPSESIRFIVAKGSTDESGCEVAVPRGVVSKMHEVFDRAHFPTVPTDETRSPGDTAPLPLYSGRQIELSTVQEPLREGSLARSAP